jgi:hypothetical protein
MRKIYSLAALETYLSDHEREFKLYRDKGKLFSALKRIAGPLLGILEYLRISGPFGLHLVSSYKIVSYSSPP